MAARGGEFNRVGGDHFFRVDNNSFTVTAIRNPSDGRIEARNTIIVFGNDLRDRLQRVVQGQGTWNELVAGHPDLLQHPFVAANAVEFEWGPYMWQAGGIDRPGPGNGQDGVQLNAEGLLREIINRRAMLRLEDPLTIPFTNVSMNREPDNLCVDAFIGPVPRDADRSVEGVIALARERHLEVVFFDVLGCVRASTSTEAERSKRPGVKRAVVYNNHIYPLTHGCRPILVKKPIHVLEDQHDMLRVYDPDGEHTGAMFYQRNNMFYIHHTGDPTLDGVHVPMPTAYEEWMDDLIDAVPVGAGWDPVVWSMMRPSAQSLLYNHPMVCAVPVNELIAVDMTKCYYNTLLSLATRGQLVGADLFATWEPVEPGHVVDWYCYYRVDCTAVMLRDLGLMSNVMPGETLKLLQDNEPRAGWRATHYVKLPVLGGKVSKAIQTVLEQWHDDDDRKKKYAVINGILGRVVQRDSLSIDIPEPEEREYYEQRHGFRSYGAFLQREQATERVTHKFHVHAHVIHMASYFVLKQMFAIRRATGARPWRIKVDSLTYRKVDLTTPFYPDSNANLRELLECELWHTEDAKHPVAEAPVPRVWPVPPDAPQYPGNRTFIGPPGTGKTHRALELPHDLAICYSNKGARRVNGKTLHAAFKVWRSEADVSCDNRMLEDLRDKVVVVDEAQAAPRRFWAMFEHAYRNLGTRFIFAMDPDQLAPVNETPVHIIPLCGEVEELVVDHRNDASLVTARQQVLNGTFCPNITPYMWTGLFATIPPRLTKLNIAYTNRTCARVNEMVAEELGVEFGKSGMYIACDTIKRPELFNGEILWAQMSSDLEGNRAFTVMDDERRTVYLSPRQVQRLLKFAYCTTVHKQIGETFREDFTIWDADHPLMDKRIMYTAITRGCSMRQITFRGSPPTRPPSGLMLCAQQASRG